MKIYTKSLNHKNYSLIIFAFIFVVIASWFAFQPRYFANVDEHNYLRTAWKLKHMEPLGEVDTFQNLGGFLNDRGEYVSKYNIGNSVWLAPIADMPIEIVFVWSLLTYLLIIFVGNEIFKELKINRQWLLVLILSPPLIYFSRTLFSELPAALMIQVSYLAYLRKDKNWGYKIMLGASLGLMVLIRYNLLIWALIIITSIFFENYKNKTQVLRIIKNVTPILLAAAPFAAWLLFTNKILYGGYLSSGYRYSGEEKLIFSEIYRRLPSYMITTNLLYPGQFLLTAISKRPLAKQLVTTNISTLLLYSTAGGFLLEGQITDLITGIRFFIPLLPLNLIFFSDVLSRYINLKKIKIQIIFLLVCLILLIVNAYMQKSHQDFIDERREKVDLINTFVEPETLFIGDEEDFIYLGEFSDKDFDAAGYIPANKVTIGKLNILSETNRIYFLEIKYDSRNDRPTENMVDLIVEFQGQNSLKLAAENKNIKIYEYKRNKK